MTIRPRLLLLAALLLAGCGSPLEGTAQATGLLVNHNDVVVEVGDSITTGFHGVPWPSAGWQSGIEAAFTTQAPAGHATGTAGHATGTAGTTPGHIYWPTFINRGHNSYGVQQLIDGFAADVQPFSPNVVVIQNGLVDLLLNGTSPAAYQTLVHNYIALVRGTFPSVRLAWMGLLMYGEQYPDPSFWSVNGLYTAYELAARTEIEAVGGTFIDIRTPQQTYESIHNVPSPGATGGILSDEAIGQHPNAALGDPLVSAAATAVTATGAIPP